ncbi:MAG TPA: YjbH domain-containing protein [Rhabdochlamydiaceae bacterium]|nr:YjbH domain-containing protein [Rhabdochlamydiaceae bacterium]
MFFLLFFLVIGALLSAEQDSSMLFRDLALVEEIDKNIEDELPFFYNSSMMGGYFNMPSARVAHDGTIGLGAARVHPYNIYGLNFQYFDRVELALNYRVYTGRLDPVLGCFGFGDEAERIANFKFVFNLPSDGLADFPTFAIGAEDFIGTQRFNSEYIVMTKDWNKGNIEATLGWGRKRIKGFFGGVVWTPWRKTGYPLLKNLSFLAEYDATDYANHIHEHPKGRNVSSHINAGVSYVLAETLQLSLSSLRGCALSAMGSLRYPLGSSKGFFTKTHEPVLYKSPVDTEPLGLVRPDRDFVNELGFTLGQQGLDLYRVYLSSQGELWVKIINNMYREEHIVRERLQRVLAAITPSNIKKVVVVVEADGVLSQGYTFRTEDLYRYRQNQVTAFELETLSPMTNPPPRPEDSTRLFRRKKEVWLFTLCPRLQTFFGSSTGKFKYNLSLVATPEGYLFDDIYYETQFSYAISSSFQKLSSTDRLNPSQLPNVRTDTIKYFQTNTVSFEMAYLQKSWNIKNSGCFFRLAGGYFEPAYGGEAAELLYYPVGSNWAIGAEQATVWKRHYQGLRFTNKIRRLHGHHAHYEPFLGVQYFADLYYTLRPWNLDFKVKVGQFLAKDRGVRFEMSRWFASGLKVALWYTITNGHDHVNHKTYYDKGFAIMLPLDFFLTRSSRTYIGYAMSAWLRDVGASADNGKGLYQTVRLERLQLK